MELTERTAQIIRSLKFDSNAKIIYCQLPLGSITWSDEIPEDDLSSFWIGPDRDHILKLYGIRMNYWDTGTMSEEDKAYWEEAKKQFPEWPIFQRMELNEEERQAHEAVEKEVEEWIGGYIRMQTN
jgi:hypothetical protein